MPAHAATVFAALRGRAQFGRVGAVGVAIGVPWDGLTGIFCLAVARDHRRQGLARALVGGQLRRAAHDQLIYAQVEAGNRAALGLYARLGLREAYRYSHWVAPDPDQTVSACPG